MKKLTFLLGLVMSLFIANSASASDNDSTEIKFEITEYDFGTIAYDGNGSCEFKFTNTGNAPLVLSNVRSSCGCTVPQWPREPIAPGQSSSISVKYDTKRVGSFTKAITVSSNTKTPEIRLQIKGVVESQANE